MKLRAQDVDDGLRGWIRSEIEKASARGYDLGKFFFTVSAGTIAAITGLAKLGSTTQVGAVFIASLGILFVSILIALNMVMPRSFVVGEDTDLEVAYGEQIRSTSRAVWIWFAVWLIGTLLGGFSVFL